MDVTFFVGSNLHNNIDNINLISDPVIYNLSSAFCNNEGVYKDLNIHNIENDCDLDF
jgi:hypothetical protein